MGPADQGVRATDLVPERASGVAVAVRELCRSFGGLRAVNNLSFDVEAGRITGLIGPNGAGKSTAANLIAGALRPDSGSITLAGQDVTGWPSYKLARAGVIRTFQLARVFSGLTVLENILVGVQGHEGESLRNVFFAARSVRARELAILPQAVDLLELYGLYELRDRDAGELSGGQKRLLELARAEMAKPRVLVLDEPMSGVNPALVDVIAGHVTGMMQKGVTVIIIEHNMDIIERICNNVIVMVQGAALVRGNMADLRRHPEVISAYLGEVKL